MKIIWNKVTWYSWSLALLIFFLTPFWGFYLGYQYGAAAGFTQGITAFAHIKAR